MTVIMMMMTMTVMMTMMMMMMMMMSVSGGEGQGPRSLGRVVPVWLYDLPRPNMGDNCNRDDDDDDDDDDCTSPHLALWCLFPYMVDNPDDSDVMILIIH